MKPIWIALSAAVLLGSGCSGSSDEAGPIDGTWLVTELTCDGAAQPLGEFVLTVENTAGTFQQTFTPDCVASLEETYAYPDAQTFSITATSIVCQPNTGCPAIFGGADCPPIPPQTDFTYTRTGAVLGFSRVSSLPSDPCPAGEQVEFTLMKQ